MVAYMNEQYRRDLNSRRQLVARAVTAANTWHADISDTVNTFMAAVNWGAIPDKLDFALTLYDVAVNNDSQHR